MDTQYTPKEQEAHDALMEELSRRGLTGISKDAEAMGGPDTTLDAINRTAVQPQDLTGEAPSATMAPDKGLTPPPMPKADLSAPLGYQAPIKPRPQDTELAGLQSDARARRGMAGLGQAITNSMETPSAMSRLHFGAGSMAPAQNPQSDLWKNYGEEGDKAVSDLMERRKSEAAMGVQQTAADLKSKMDDKNSAESKFARQFTYAVAPQLQGKFDEASATQMTAVNPVLSKLIEQHGGEIKANADAAAKAVAEKEKAAATQEGARRFEVTHEDARKNAEAGQAIAKAHLGLSYDEANRKRLEAEEKAKTAEAAKGVAAESAKIPFSTGRFVPREGTKPDEMGERQAKANAALYGAAISGIDGLKQAIAEFGANPSAATKDNVTAQVRVTSAALNAATGQGAMSGDEAAQNEKALGANLASTAGAQAFIDNIFGATPAEIAPVITRRAEAVKKNMINQANARMKSYNYEYEEAAPKSSPPGENQQKMGPGGKMVEKGADGRWHEVGSQ